MATRTFSPAATDAARKRPGGPLRNALFAALWLLALSGLPAAVFVSGCDAGGDDGAGMNHTNNNGYFDAGTSADGADWECFSANDCPPGQYCNEFHQCVYPPQQDGGVDGYLPPEVEQEFSPPASGNRYVYVALPEQDVVVRIDSETLEVTSLVVGDRPTVLATAPGRDLAVVLNSGSDSLSILRTSDGVDTIVNLDAPPHLNRLAIGPLGTVALAYFELEQADTQGIGSFQDVSLVDLTPGQQAVFNVSVGFRPRDVMFSASEQTAFVITEDGVSILDTQDLSGGYVAPTVAVSDDPLADGQPAEVIVTPDGNYAFARWSWMEAVRAINLQTETLTDTPLSGPPTDIDLTASGDRLVAVVRESAQVHIMDVPTDIGDASAVETVDCTGLAIGSAILTADEQHALLFTNASNSKLLSVLELDTAVLDTALLKKGIRTVALAPDGQTALVLHNKIPGEPLPSDDFETQLDKRYGFSLFQLDTLFAKLQITDANPGAFAFMPDSRAAYLIVADPTRDLKKVLGLNLSNLIVDTYPMGSHPVELGVVPSTERIYVSQDHPMGRVSFINANTEEVRTVTGFQLNSQITE
jgi:DNA-binding beta-propeller fold protein YncE